MAEYFVLHARKIHTETGCKEVLKHNFRQKSNLKEFVDENKSRYNNYVGANNEKFSEKFKEFTVNLPRKIQKNASLIIEVVVSFSHEFGREWETNPAKKREIEIFFNDTEIFFKRRYGDVILSRTDHYDEKTPHSHILLVPLCKNKNGVLRFSSSEFLGGFKGLYDLHDKFHFEVGNKYGLKRGNRGERTTHSDLKDYAEWEKSQRLIIEEKNKKLNKQLAEVQRKHVLIAQNSLFLNDEMMRNFKQRGELFSKSIQVSNKEKNLELIDEDILKQTPQIPIPPIQLIEKSRRKWIENIQKMVNKSFAKIVKGYIFLKKKYFDLRQRMNYITNQNQQYKNRAEKAEKDLFEKPINEIIAMRKKLIKNEQEKINTNDRRGFSL